MNNLLLVIGVLFTLFIAVEALLVIFNKKSYPEAVSEIRLITIYTVSLIISIIIIEVL